MFANFPSLLRQRMTEVLLILSAVLIFFSCVRLALAIGQFSSKRAEAITIGTRLPALRSKVALLSANVEAQKLLGAQALTSREEIASAYILPKQPSGNRIVQLLEEAVRALRVEDSTMQIKQLTVGGAQQTGSGQLVHEQPVHVELTGSIPAVSRLIALLEHGGEITVQDAMEQEQSALILREVEEIAPLFLSHAAEFLATDLLKYASNPDEEENRLLRDMPTDAATHIRALFIDAGLGHVRASLSPVAKQLYASRVWPLPMTRLVAVEYDGAVWRMQLKLLSR